MVRDCCTACLRGACTASGALRLTRRGAFAIVCAVFRLRTANNNLRYYQTQCRNNDGVSFIWLVHRGYDTLRANRGAGLARLELTDGRHRTGIAAKPGPAVEIAPARVGAAVRA